MKGTLETEEEEGELRTQKVAGRVVSAQRNHQKQKRGNTCKKGKQEKVAWGGKRLRWGGQSIWMKWERRI